jgi:hypothetical protein
MYIGHITNSIRAHHWRDQLFCPVKWSVAKDSANLGNRNLLNDTSIVTKKCGLLGQMIKEMIRVSNFLIILFYKYL